MRYVGVDVGFGYTKAMDNRRAILFPSIVSPEVEFTFRSGLEREDDPLDHLAIRFQGTSHFVGQLALRQGRFAHCTLDRMRTQTEEYRILFLTALALLAESPDEEFSVMTGLPVDDFEDHHWIEENLSDRFPLSLSGRETSLIIRKLMVVPQPYGALMDLIFMDTLGNMDERFFEARVGIVDIGFKTTDFVLVNKGEFIQKLSGSLKKGMSTLYQAAIPKFTASYPGNWDLHTVEESYRRGAILHLGKRIEIDTALLDPDLAAIAGEFVAWIRGRWSGEPIDYLVCSGGGGLPLKPYLLKAFPQMLFLNDPQQANVRGYQKGAFYFHG
jgi:plasmid segregation protein ParM